MRDVRVDVREATSDCDFIRDDDVLRRRIRGHNKLIAAETVSDDERDDSPAAERQRDERRIESEPGQRHRPNVKRASVRPSSQQFAPYADRFVAGKPSAGVDLVVCGHEHHYERSHPIRGRESNTTLTPVPAATATDVIDTSKETVHMVIGVDGTSSPTNQRFFNPPQCRVITGVGEPDPATGKRPPVYVKEQAPWSAVRNAAHSYGFAASIVDPGSHRGGITTIKVTYYDVVGPGGQLAPFETLTLRHPCGSIINSSCSSGDPIRLHKEIGRDLPTGSDLLDHLEGKGPATGQDFRRSRPRAQNVCKLRLTVTEFLDRIVQHIHWVKPPTTLERPAPLLIRLDQRDENVELITLWCPTGRAPKLLDLRECSAVVFFIANRADLHSGLIKNER